MRNLYGIIPIKVRAKNSSTIDLSDFDIDDVVIDGSFASAKDGKLISLDIFIVDANDKHITYQGITQLHDNVVEIVAIDTTTPKSIQIIANDTTFDIASLI